MHLRRALGPIAAVWLLCQTTSMALAPALLWQGSAAGVVECTCAHGDHSICPMHHKPAADPNRCAMRSADSGDPAVLTALFPAIGTIPVRTHTRVLEPRHRVRVGDVSVAFFAPTAPDPPPPRS